MTNGTQQQGLTPQDFHSARAEITTEGVKGLFLINGGGSVALLAFLQAVWEKQPQLAKFVVIGIGILCLGLVFAGLINCKSRPIPLFLVRHQKPKSHRFLVLCFFAIFMLGNLISHSQNK